MAVKKISSDPHLNKDEYIGLSTDTKPTDCGGGSTYLELDTKKVFMYDGTTWYEL